MNDNLIYWIWLTQIKGIGPITARILIDKFKEPICVYEANIEKLIEIKGIGESIATVILNSKDLSFAKEIFNKCKKLNVKIVTIKDKLYPDYAKNTFKAPILLYYRGTLIENSIGVSIVGTRRCTEYGKNVVIDASKYLSEKHIPVIGGMAKGIDSYAHTACIKNGGYTIAVLGCGVDICYPKEHIELMKKIIENGAVISEYPLGIKPNAVHFPERNRIISAFSRKILIVEASKSSGALIIANLGNKMSREIYAVPNGIYSFEGQGCNELISNGAKIYLNPQQLNFNEEEHECCLNDNQGNIGTAEINTKEQEILSIIKMKSCSVDEIRLQLKIGYDEITEVLFNLEIKGLVNFAYGKYVAINTMV